MLKRSLIVLGAALAVAAPAAEARPTLPDLSGLDPVLCEAQRIVIENTTISDHPMPYECIGWPDNDRSASTDAGDVVRCTVRWATTPNVDQTWACVRPTR